MQGHNKGRKSAYETRSTWAIQVSLDIPDNLPYSKFMDRLVQLFLVAGHLVEFRVTPGSSLHTAMQRTNLLDAYICSGYLAALALPQGQYDPGNNPEARRYQDGLETDDPEEEMLFTVWFRPQPSMVDKASLPGTTTDMPKAVPALSAKGKILVVRTRSKLERDAWCWALNSEIERIVRSQKQREARLRETGNLKKF